MEPTTTSDPAPAHTGDQSREQWSSKIGFVLAAAGSAIGLGNIWRFPYVTGENGGAAFVIVYLACIALICLPYLLAELALGRHSQKNPVGAIKAVAGRTPWVIVGGLGILTGLFILSYYGVIAGWTFGYIFKNVVSPDTAFADFIATPGLVLPLFALFLGSTAAIVQGGVEDGIERAAKVLMPILLVLMLLVIVRGVTLEGASAGLSFYLNPDFSKIGSEAIVAALGQAFFSLSLGMGAMVTYGSYLPEKENLLSAGGYVALFDTGIALLAGLMIFPAVFALDGNPQAGPTLVFDVLPGLFQQMPLGTSVGMLFFLLLSVAALTSTVSLMEVVVSYCMDERHWSRSKSVAVVTGGAFAFGFPAALSQGVSPTLTDMTWLVGEGGVLGATDFLGIMDTIWGNISLALGALLLCVFAGWVWGVADAAAEIRSGAGTFAPGAAQVWGMFIKYVCPLVILVVLLDAFQVI
jgi:NSS family neurotransmitter:Na+ symporter